MNEFTPFSIESAHKLLDNLYQHQQRFLFSEEALVEITRASIEPLLKKTCQEVAELMDFERVEIWLFNEAQTELTAETYYDNRGEISAFKNTLYAHKVPAYFEAIVDQRVLAVETIEGHPAMDGLRDSLSTEYHGMSSMLDASIVLSWGVGGVICCLSKEPRSWTPVHKQVLASIADMLAFIFDRLHRKEVEEHVYELAYRDPLTGLKNEHAFHEKVTEQLKQIPDGEQGIFIYLIIDQYADICGVLGFDAGEQVLMKIGDRLQKLLPEPATLARIGFDHFVIYAPLLFKADKMKQYMNEITNRLREPLEIVGQEVFITFSYGAAYYPTYVKDVKEGIQAAQVALEHAKKQKTRRASGHFQSYMHQFVKDHLFSEMNLRKGLDLDQFRLFYQPKVQATTGEIIGFEALIRWQHPDKGLIFPNDFIKLAESTGLIHAIGEWVINEAFKQLSQWKNTVNAHLSIAINLSSDHFLECKLPVYLVECVEKYGVGAEKLILEITENIALEDRELVASRLIELKELGFLISIDDFGTGYSAFAYLQNYPVKQIKVDRQFIQNIHLNERNRIITETIIQLGKKLDLNVVVEGIEKIEEWQCIQKMGCDELQGYYFAKPLPIEEIEHLLSRSEEEGKTYLP